MVSHICSPPFPLPAFQFRPQPLTWTATEAFHHLHASSLSHSASSCFSDLHAVIALYLWGWEELDSSWLLRIKHKKNEDIYLWGWLKKRKGLGRVRINGTEWACLTLPLCVKEQMVGGWKKWVFQVAPKLGMDGHKVIIKSSESWLELGELDDGN